MLRRTSVLLLTALTSIAARAQYVTLTGTLQSAGGAPLASGELAFTPTQWMYIAGTGVVVDSTVNCATSPAGGVVGIANPQGTPSAIAQGGGTLPAGLYYVEYAWHDAVGHITGASPEQQVQLSAAGSLLVQPPQSGMPTAAAGMDIYIGTASGGETLQGTTMGTASYVQSSTLVAGGAAPGANTTQCRVVANDAGWPTGGGYTVSVSEASGNTLPGYPMTWRILGAGMTVDLSGGLPLYDGQVYFPAPILATPPNGATQSISGGLVIFGNQPVLTASTAQISRGTPGALSVPWGFSPGWTFGGAPVSSYQSYSVPPAAPNLLQSQMQIQTKFSYTSDLPPDFPGAPGASFPAVYSEVETSGGSNIEPSAIAGFCVNGGSQDCVGVSGRMLVKEGPGSTTSGLRDAFGVHGDGYNLNTQAAGYRGGVEATVYQNVAGTQPGDFPPPAAPGAAVALHVNSISTGSRAFALIAGDAASEGSYGAWNFEVCDNSTWNGANGAPANGLAGTVCWNGGDWDSAKYPQIGMKMGNAGFAHLLFSYGDAIFRSHTGVFHLWNDGTTTAGAGIDIAPSAGHPAFVNFQDGGGYVRGTIFLDAAHSTFTINDWHSNTAGGVGVDTYINPNGGFAHVASNTPFSTSDNSDKVVNSAWVKALLATSSASLQHLAITSGICTATGGSYNTCTMGAQNWPVAFADATYAVSCSGLSPSNGSGSSGSVAGNIFNVVKSATGITISLQSATSAGFSYGEIDCIAQHN